MPRPRARGKLRLLLVAALFAGLWIAGKTSGVLDDLDTERIRALVDGAGVFGALLFIAIFAVGELLHVPGMLFVGAGILAYGKLAGFAVSLAAALVSISVSFIVVRAVGGKALAEIERPFVKKMLARLERQPVRTVFVLRVVLWLAPALNYALALTSIRFRDYFIGSALGLVPPLIAAALMFDWLIKYLGA